MTSRFERRLARIEKQQRRATEAPTDPRMFVMATLVGFHCCDRREDEHPLQAYSAAAKGPDGEAGMHALLDGFFAAHGVNMDAEPTPDALRAMQRLLDGVPDRWRDADLAWWPRTAIEMWAGPFAQEASWREDNRRLSSGEEVSRIAGLAMASEQPVDFCGYWQRHIGD